MLQFQFGAERDPVVKIVAEIDDEPVKVEFARTYARLVYDRELHDRLLEDVLAADPDVPGLTLVISPIGCPCLFITQPTLNLGSIEPPLADKHRGLFDNSIYFVP